MKALDGQVVPVALPKLPAGPDGVSPDPAAALAVPSATKAAAAARSPHNLLIGD